MFGSFSTVVSGTVETNSLRHPPCSEHSSYYGCRYADRLAGAHDAEHLGKFEELLEAAIDLDRIPDEYLIAASYDPQLQARPCWGLTFTGFMLPKPLCKPADT